MVDLGLCIAGLGHQKLAGGVDLGRSDGLAKLLGGGCLQSGGLLLLVADDVLDGLGERCHIALLHILADLHGLFQGVVVIRLAQNEDGLAVGFRPQEQGGFMRNIAGNRQEAQLHAAGDGTDGGVVHHGIEGEVVLAAAVLFISVDIGENHVADPLHDGGSIHGGLVADGTLDILLLVGQEVVGIAGAANVVLTKQIVQRLPHLLAENDFVGADIIGHQNHDVIQIGRHIVVDVANQVEELQHIHIVRSDTCTGCRSSVAAVNNPADGAIQEAVNGVVEAEEGDQCVLIPILDVLCSFLEAGEHGSLAA